MIITGCIPIETATYLLLVADHGSHEPVECLTYSSLVSPIGYFSSDISKHLRIMKGYTMQAAPKQATSSMAE
jgi:hypothetical protein